MIIKKLSLLAVFILSQIAFASPEQTQDQIQDQSHIPAIFRQPKQSALDKISNIKPNATYRVGDEWGKYPVTIQNLPQESAVFQRAAKATGRIDLGIFGGYATGFLLGRFDNRYILATNHHVCEDAIGCVDKFVTFPLLNKRFQITKVLGSYSDIDFALTIISVPLPADQALVDSVSRNLAFRADLVPNQPLMTIGFGSANNPNKLLMANKDSDCRVFSEVNEFRFMGDPDELNPGPYKAWSFANGCDISHGDSGSSMVDRNTGDVVGIIWTGKIPKSAAAQSSKAIAEMQTNHSEGIWTELSYAVPAPKIGEYLDTARQAPGVDPDTARIFTAILQ